MVVTESNSHLIKMLSENFSQGFEKMETNVMAYPNDWLLWVKEREVQNSGGSLCLYLLGNLAHCFSLISQNQHRTDWMELRQSSRHDMINAIRTVKTHILDYLSITTDQEMDQIYPLPFRGLNITTSAYLVHLLAELNYHLGQINYHRRMI